jgi:hypothetical protein
VPLEVRQAVGPEINQATVYAIGGVPAGWSLDGTIPRPDGGRWWLRVDGANRAFFDVSSLGNPSKPVRWIAGTYRIDEAPKAPGDIVGLVQWDQTVAGDPRALQLRSIGGGLWGIRLTSLAGATLIDSTIGFEAGQNVPILVEFDGTLLRVWANHVLQLQYPTAYLPFSSRVMLLGSVSSANTYVRRWRSTAFLEADSSADRPDAAIEIHAHYPDGEGFYNDTGGTFAAWDDWIADGVADDDATFITVPGVALAKKTSTLTSASYSKTLRALMAHAWARYTAGFLIFPPQFIIRAAGVNARMDVSTFSGSYQGIRAVFNSPPTGSWPGIIDALEGGFEQDDSALLELRVSAIGFSGVAIDPFPVPRTGFARSKKKSRAERKRQGERERAAGERLRAKQDDALEMMRALDRRPQAEIEEEFAVLRLLYRL